MDSPSRITTVRACLAWIAAVASTPIHATLVVDSHYVLETELQDRVEVHQDGKFEIASGHLIAPGGSTDRLIWLGRGSVVVSGTGRITANAGQNALYSSNGNVSLQDYSTVEGRLISDANYPAPRALSLSDHAVVRGGIAWNGVVEISDAAFITGDVTDTNGYLFLDMSGGTVQGRVRASWLGESRFDISGGSILGGVHCAALERCDIEIKNGRISNGIDLSADTGKANVLIAGGRVDGGISSSSRDVHSVRVFGGQFDALNEFLISAGTTDIRARPNHHSTFDIFGGQWGYTDQGLGWQFDGFSNLNVYGWDLQFADGRLSGFLSDGSWIDTALNFGDNWLGSFQIHRYNQAVPEPATWALLLIGLVGIRVSCRASLRVD